MKLCFHSVYSFLNQGSKKDASTLLSHEANQPHGKAFVDQPSATKNRLYLTAHAFNFVVSAFSGWQECGFWFSNHTRYLLKRLFAFAFRGHHHDLAC